MLRSTSRSPARLSHSARHRPSGSYSGREIISSRPIRRIALLAIILCSIPLLLWQIGFSLWGRKSRVIIDPLLGDRGSSLGVAETLQEEDGSKEWPSILTTGSAGDIRIIWKERVPPSRLLAHAPGWTILENVILLNGTIYIISDDPTAIPSIKTIMSNGIPIPEAGPMSDVTITPGQMQIIGTWDARELFGRSAGVLDGTTFLCSDAPQYASHYFHFWGEILFGLWRTYTSLPSPSPLPAPRRLILPHIPRSSWKDYTGLSKYLSLAIFPTISYEFQDEWEERGGLGRPFMVERVVIGDRIGATWGNEYGTLVRMSHGAFSLGEGKKGDAMWWTPIRKSLLSFLGNDKLPTKSSGPVITYISRQKWGRRMLRQSDHVALVEALGDLRDTYGYEVNVVEMEALGREEQIRLALRTTVLLGVHGNGLTHAIWLEPTSAHKRTALMEFFYPGGFCYDYEYLCRTLGITYFGWWGDRLLNSSSFPPRAYPEGFQGNDIPVNAGEVARAIRDHVEGVGGW